MEDPAIGAGCGGGRIFIREGTRSIGLFRPPDTGGGEKFRGAPAFMLPTQGAASDSSFMKELRVTLDGAAFAVRLDSKITKESLYGGIETVVEKDGRRLSPGYLLPDGQMLRRSQIANAALDTEGTPVEPPQMLRDDQVAEQEPRVTVRL